VGAIGHLSLSLSLSISLCRRQYLAGRLCLLFGDKMHGFVMVMMMMMMMMMMTRRRRRRKRINKTRCNGALNHGGDFGL